MNIQIRELVLEDYNDGFIDVLSQLSRVGNITFEQFCRTFHNRKRLDTITYVAYNVDSNRVVGTGSVHFDEKFLHNCSPAAYIEDVVVDINYRELGIGRMIVNKLVDVARDRMCYKVLLWCSVENVEFYKKLGFYVTYNNIMRLDI